MRIIFAVYKILILSIVPSSLIMFFYWRTYKVAVSIQKATKQQHHRCPEILTTTIQVKKNIQKSRQDVTLRIHVGNNDNIDNNIDNCNVGPSNVKSSTISVRYK